LLGCRAGRAIVTKGGTDFWTFSLAVYGREPVQQECLTLQDRFGMDVNLVLLCAFAGAIHGAVLPERNMEEAIAAVGPWHQQVVRNLRETRRALKPFLTTSPPVSTPIANLRAQVKTQELEAERIEQQILEHWLTANVGSFSRAEPRTAVEGNMRTLFALSARNHEPPGLPQDLITAALAIGSAGA
jgi:uncharacterized protein (TIGR02444 family)